MAAMSASHVQAQGHTPKWQGRPRIAQGIEVQYITSRSLNAAEAVRRSEWVAVECREVVRVAMILDPRLLTAYPPVIRADDWI